MNRIIDILFMLVTKLLILMMLFWSPLGVANSCGSARTMIYENYVRYAVREISVGRVNNMQCEGFVPELERLNDLLEDSGLGPAMR